MSWRVSLPSLAEMIRVVRGFGGVHSGGTGAGAVVWQPSCVLMIW
jgi:hypothetical protein